VLVGWIQRQARTAEKALSGARFQGTLQSSHAQCSQAADVGSVPCPASFPMRTLSGRKRSVM